MKRYVKAMACLLAAVLLCACNSAPEQGDRGQAPIQGEEPTTTGRFFEQAIEQPTGAGEDLFLLPDGQIAVFNDEYTIRWVSADYGQTWQEESGWLAKAGLTGQVRGAALAEDGDLLVALMADYEAPPVLYRVARDGACTALECDEIEKFHESYGGAWPTQLAVGQDRILLTLMGSDEQQTFKTLLLDAAGTYLMTLEGGASWHALFDGDALYRLTMYSTPERFDAATAERLATHTKGYSLGRLAAFEGTAYVADTTGIYRLGEDLAGELVLDSAAYAFGDANTMVEAFYVLAPDVFLLRNGRGTFLYQQGGTQATETLRIYSLMDDNTLRQAVYQFSQGNPGVEVQLEVVDWIGNRLDYEDVLKQLATELVAGQGADILVLDNLPFENYVAQGALLDMAGYLDVSGVYPGFVEGLNPGGGLYALPGGYATTLLLRTPEAPEMDLEALADAVGQGGSALLDMAKEEGIYTLWDCVGSSVVRDNALDIPRLERYLADVRAFDAASTGGSDNSLGIGVSWGEVTLNLSVWGSAAPFLEGERDYALFSLDDFSSLMLLQNMHTLEYFVLDDIALAPAEYGGEVLWKPQTTLGVTASCEQPELAAAFLQTLLGDEVQGALGRAGLPVTKAGSDALFGVYKAFMEQEMAAQASQPLNLNNLHDEIVASLTGPVFFDMSVSGPVMAAAWEVCEGLDLAEGVKRVESDLQTYLDERQA